jgi:hypothetical protein
MVEIDLSMRRIMNPESFEGWKYLKKQKTAKTIAN